MNPHIINLLIKGHKEKTKEKDYLAWLFSQYTLSAVFYAIEHNFHGQKAKSSYIEKPFLQEHLEEKTSDYKESQEEVAIFEMNQRINLLRKQGLPESPA